MGQGLFRPGGEGRTLTVREGGRREAFLAGAGLRGAGGVGGGRLRRWRERWWERGTPAPEGGSTPAAEVEVPESLHFLGDLAKVRSAPVTETFDASARSLPLADGVMLEVPAGAFGAPTEVTVVVADLAFDAYVDDAPEGTVYVVSTDEPVDLAAPVVLELPVPADSVRVVQSLDGDDWRAVEVPPGATTRVPIPHFSTTHTIVTGPREGALVLQGPPADGEAPGLFLRACILSIAETLEAAGGTTGDRVTQDSFDIAAWLCTRALVQKFSPTGDYVSVACVGDTMDRGADFRRGDRRLRRPSGRDRHHEHGTSRARHDHHPSAGGARRRRRRPVRRHGQI